MRAKQSIAGRITIGHTIYAFKDGGMERGLLNLVNHSDRDRFRHVVLCLTEAGAFASQVVAPDCEVIELRKPDGNDLRLPSRIAASARQHQVDILHARGWPTLVETALAAILAGIKATIYGFHGKTMQDLQGISHARRLTQKLFVRCYQRVVTLNRRMRADLAAQCSLPENRIDIIGNGVDIDVFRPRAGRRELRVLFGLPPTRFIIGNVARLDPVKNHEVILRAIRRLHSDTCRPLVLLIGDGSHRPVLEREIERLGVAEDVRLFGYSDRVPELLNCMDVYVQPSLYEGFSNTVVEAMASGLPVLATDVGGTADLFSEEHEGLFFRPEKDEALASLIVRLQHNSSLRRAMAARARHRVVERFSIQTMVRNYETMYLEVLGQPTIEENGPALI